MLYSIGLILGAGLGGLAARRGGGNGFDVAQYAAVGGVIGFLAGIALTVALARLTGG